MSLHRLLWRAYGAVGTGARATRVTQLPLGRYTLGRTLDRVVRGYVFSPVLLRTSLKLGKRIKGYGFTLLVILLLVLSFPTFLVFNNRISTDTFYSYEMSAAEFLERSYGNGEGLTVVNPYVPVMYYVPDAHPEMGYWYAGYSRTEDEFWRRVDEIVETYSISRGGHTLFMMHDRLKVLGEFVVGISPSDPHWRLIENRIKDRLIDNSNIYDSGYAQIYQ